MSMKGSRRDESGFVYGAGSDALLWVGDILSGCSANTSGTTTGQDPTKVSWITARLNRQRRLRRRSTRRMFVESMSSAD
jgi:hypothetical protein